MSENTPTPEPDDGEYGLVMPFVVTYDECDEEDMRSDDRPYEAGAFVAGCYHGEIAGWLAAAQEYPGANGRLATGWWVPSPVVPQLDLLAMHHGYTLTAEPWDEYPEEHTYVSFAKAASVEPA